MNTRAIIIITLFFIPTIIGTSWFVGYVFFEAHLLWILFGSGSFVAVATLFFGFSLRREVDTSVSKVLESNNHFYQDLFTYSPLPYFIINDKGKVLSGNTAAARLLEIKVDELSNFNIFPALNSQENTTIDIILSKISSGVSLKDIELVLETPTHIKKWVSLTLHVNQATRQRLLSLIDITDKKRVDIAKSEFASLVTHQLRTPVAAMRWNAELLERTLPQPPSELQQKYVEKVKRNIHRMLDLINDFLSVSKLETGTFESSPESINLTDYFDSIVDEYTGMIAEKSLTIQKEYSAYDVTITIDTRLFHIITSNLLSNAIKYTPAGGTVVFGFSIISNQCHITVADSGIGIPQSEQAKLFSKFFRASNAVQHRAEGTGLGLYIVQQSVEKLKGSISFNSIENQGTAFKVIIPVLTT